MRSGLVSVILVSRNCAPLIDVVFPTLVAQTYQPLDIVVVDNGSTDETVACLERRYPSVRVVKLAENLGFSHALNRGIRDTDGEFVLSLNFDVTLEPGFVAALVAALRQRPLAGWAAGAMRRLLPTGPSDEIDCNGHYLLRSRYVYGFDPDRPDPTAYQASREVFGASGCAAMYRRSLLEDVALDGEMFDEDFFAYFEDVDLDWRAQRRGHTCLFVPDARGAHMRGGTGLSERPEVAAMLVSNRFLAMIKNDELRDVMHDLSPIVRRTLVDLRIQFRKHPRSIPLALSRLVRLTPRMVAKRRRLRQDRQRGPTPVARLRLRTRFLG